MKDRTDTTLTSTTKTMPVATEEHERAREPLPIRPPRKHPQGTTKAVADQIDPRTVGTEYDNSAGAYRVLAVVTDPSEARRILRRNAARFAVLIRDLHTGTEHYTGATWTGSDRVLKAVA